MQLLRRQHRDHVGVRKEPLDDSEVSRFDGRHRRLDLHAAARLLRRAPVRERAEFGEHALSAFQHGPADRCREHTRRLAIEQRFAAGRFEFLPLAFEVSANSVRR